LISGTLTGYDGAWLEGGAVTRLGFVIDQRACIGCHACTVACKEENGVPLGVFRTWVKYVDKGTFPDTRRHFLVERCNHCDNAPCIAICPTRALFRRPDGIVDIDPDRCIGCKSCMQACPYDAIYIDPETHTAAKCNFCAHRVEVGLQPACVNVCPEQAIITGDLDDPESRISRLVARNAVQVRRPDQGTQPKLFYLGADASALVPEMTEEPEAYMWAQVRPHDPAVHRPVARPGGRLSPPPEPMRLSGDSGYVAGNRGAGTTYDHHAARAESSIQAPLLTPAARLPGIGRPVVSYNTAHPSPWGWRVWAYLWTKAIGAGAFLMVALALLFGVTTDRLLLGWVAPLVALAFVGATSALLVWDLKRPERFLYLLLKPNTRSWLVWGAYILIGYSGLLVLWMIGQLTGAVVLLDVMAVLGALAAVAAAGYTGFLFGQAEGRDFWQSPLLAPHLVVQAGVAGAGILAVAAAIFGSSHVVVLLLARALCGLALTNGSLIAMELASPHANRHVALATHVIKAGALSRRFWLGAVLAGTTAPVLLAGSTVFLSASPWLAAAGGALALAGLLVYESVFVIAGQAVPIS
jgi:Fe-S-cluster-containing dehydrogenase component/formate-dependent nitrite reductase membrane component NrfD